MTALIIHICQCTHIWIYTFGTIGLMVSTPSSFLIPACLIAAPLTATDSYMHWGNGSHHYRIRRSPIVRYPHDPLPSPYPTLSFESPGAVLKSSLIFSRGDRPSTWELWRPLHHHDRPLPAQHPPGLRDLRRRGEDHRPGNGGEARRLRLLHRHAHLWRRKPVPEGGNSFPGVFNHLISKSIQPF